MGVPPLRLGKHRKRNLNEEKLYHYVQSLLDGTLALYNTPVQDQPVVEDLKQGAGAELLLQRPPGMQ